MAKYRSKTNYAQIYTSDKKGYNLGLDGAIYLKRETTPRVFNPPAIGTQGKSEGGTVASTNISAGSDNKLKISVSGGAIVDVTLTQAGKTSGVLIAAELETAINAALAAAGQDARVWVDFDGGDDHYEVWNQSTGIAATVVITDGAVDNIADDLNLGVGQGGIETAGTDDSDFLLYTTGGVTFDQPVTSNAHRSGRYHTGVIKAKKNVAFDFDTYVNMSGSAGASIDNAVQLLIEAALGKKTNTGTTIDFEQDLPVIYMSMVRVSTIFGEYITGGHVGSMGLEFPGDGPATVKYQGRAADSAIAGIGLLSAPSVASAVVTLTADESEYYTETARVMAVDTDGRTILLGVDGSLSVVSYDDSLNQLTLSSPVTIGAGVYIVPWDPGAVQQTGRDAIFTDLVGHFKLDQTASAVDVTNISLNINNDHVEFDNRFGKDTNAGFAAGNRMTAELSVTFDMSNETFGKVVRSRKFEGLNPEILLGAVSGRYLKITAPKWVTNAAPIDVPENGTTPVTLTGNLFQSKAGGKDPIKLRFG